MVIYNFMPSLFFFCQLQNTLNYICFYYYKNTIFGNVNTIFFFFFFCGRRPPFKTKLQKIKKAYVRSNKQRKKNQGVRAYKHYKPTFLQICGNNMRFRQ